MDPVTALIFASLITLAVGGALGLLHHSLAPDAQPAAADWRIGTLLIAGGAIVFATSPKLPPAFVFPTANGFMLVGLTLYWRAIRKFCGLPYPAWIFVPSVIATAGLWWYASIEPSHVARMLIATPIWIVTLCGAAWDLSRSKVTGIDRSRRLMAGILWLAGGIMVLRFAYFALGLGSVQSTVDATDLLNVLSLVLIVTFPTIGTTVFLIMCAERLRWQWEEAAATDYLTALPNRRAIMSTLHARFKQARREGHALSVAVIDIDHFKSINDRFGHDVGDLALQHVAATLSAASRGAGLVGRQGGEEFVAIVDYADATAAATVCERLRSAIQSTPLDRQGTPLHMTISVGVSTLTAGDQHEDALLTRADRALYRAKQNGRNRVAVEAA
jgi:diguanylate cyclase (GGDEF)-like protein